MGPRGRQAAEIGGLEEKLGAGGTKAGALLPSCLKLGKFPPSLGRQSFGGDGAEGSWGRDVESRPGLGRERGWGAGRGQGLSRLCVVPARGAAPSLPWELRGSPLPPTCFLPQPPAPI